MVALKKELPGRRKEGRVRELVEPGCNQATEDTTGLDKSGTPEIPTRRGDNRTQKRRRPGSPRCVAKNAEAKVQLERRVPECAAHFGVRAPFLPGGRRPGGARDPAQRRVQDG